MKMTKLVDIEHKVIQEWSNSTGSYIIKAYADSTYEIIEQGKITRTVDLNRHYDEIGKNAAQHIRNDIQDGYHPMLKS
jgi:hypothetical protein